MTVQDCEHFHFSYRFQKAFFFWIVNEWDYFVKGGGTYFRLLDFFLLFFLSPGKYYWICSHKLLQWSWWHSYTEQGVIYWCKRVSYSFIIQYHKGFDCLFLWQWTLFSTMFQLYFGSKCSYPCFTAFLPVFHALFFTNHLLLSSVTVIRTMLSQQLERNGSWHNDFHQSSAKNWHKWELKWRFFYAPALLDQGHMVFGLFVCQYVRLSVCSTAKTFTLAISFDC